MDHQKIGSFIAQVRKERGLTQKELGAQLHVSDRAVSKWERGLNLPDASLFEPLCEELGITVTELLRGEREEATIPELEKMVSDTVILAGKKEKAKKRYRTLAVLLVIALLLVGKPLAEQQWMEYKNQRYRDQDTTMVEVKVHYRDAALSVDAGMLPGGRRVPRSDGGIQEIAPYVTRPPEYINNTRNVPVLDLVGREPLYFSTPNPKTEMEVKVYRWEEGQIGTEVFFTDAEPVEFGPWEFTSLVNIESEYVYIFEAEPNHVYSIVVYWGDGYFEEHCFRTI